MSVGLLAILSVETTFTRATATVGINALTMSGEEKEIDTYVKCPESVLAEA